MSETETTEIRTIAIIGGTGKEGKGLAYRWCKAGYHVIIGSRQQEKAQAAADDVRGLYPDGAVEGKTNPEAASEGDLVVLTVPYSVHREMLEMLTPYLAGKILVDVTVPIVPPKVTKVQMPPEGSAAQQALSIVGDGVQVVSAFQNISYEKLLNDEDIECDVLVCGTSKSARAQVIDLVKAAGMVGYDAGPIENSVVVEGMTSILIGLNRQFGVQSAGVKITGVPGASEE